MIDVNMQKINKGFLDENLEYKVKQYRNENKEIFDIIFELNDLLYEIEESFPRKHPTAAETYIFTLFTEIHISFQSIIMLLERGLYNDSQILMRSLYDKIIKCLYVIDNEKNLDLLNLDNNEKNISKAKYVVNNKELFDEKTVKRYKDLLEKLKQKRKYKNGKLIRIKQTRDICEELKVPELYFAYKYLSDFTHSDFYTIFRKITKNKNDIWINRSFDYSNNLWFDIEILLDTLGYIIKPICEYIKNKNLNKKYDDVLFKYEKLNKQNQ